LLYISFKSPFPAFCAANRIYATEDRHKPIYFPPSVRWAILSVLVFVVKKNIDKLSFFYWFIEKVQNNGIFISLISLMSIETMVLENGLTNWYAGSLACPLK
jgi:hypothetical protein